ncbi:hypothetical protein AMECASPLE_018289 [Ameca splendens]|uniref:Uncharacterized protein n=1 Tax=Ameca splendens TaxID=208324 RepID=A0ABV0XRS6_9TELE
MSADRNGGVSSKSPATAKLGCGQTLKGAEQHPFVCLTVGAELLPRSVGRERREESESATPGLTIKGYFLQLNKTQKCLLIV